MMWKTRVERWESACDGVKLLEMGRDDGKNIATFAETLHDAAGNPRIVNMTYNTSAISDQIQ